MKMMSVDVAGTKVHQDVLLKDDLQFLGCSVTDFSSESHAAVTNHGPNGDGIQNQAKIFARRIIQGL